MRIVARLSRRTAPRRGLHPQCRARLQVEQLESRNLLSAVVYTPAQIRHAYGFDQVAQTGAGQTIAIVDAYNDPNALKDANTFSSTFGLPALSLTNGTFKQVNQTGGSRLPRGNAGWAEEISLDVQWAHAIAPAAKILLVEANSSSYNDLLAAVKYAGGHANVVSMSWGGGELSNEASLDGTYFQTTGVTYVASSGDSGAGVEWPAASANVLAVGGTSLNLASDGSYGSESAWSSGGGGISSIEPEPGYQVLANISSGGKRTTPDVSYNADPNTGVYVYDSYGVYPGWYAFGGTSAGAPQWASLVALANQTRGSSLTGYSQVLPTLYSLPSGALHDVTSGSNGYSATVGYDLATGLGSPNAPVVIAALASTTLSPSVSGSGTSSPPGSGGSGLRHIADTTPVVVSSTGFTAVPFAVGAATQAPGTTALLTQPQLSVATLPGTTPLGGPAQATAPALLIVSAPAARPVWLVGAEDPVASDAEDTGGANVPATPGPMQPGSGETPPPDMGQGVRLGVEGVTGDDLWVFDEVEEVVVPSEGGLAAGSTSALAGLVLALGGFWGVPRDEPADQRKARAKPWPKG